MSGHAPLHQEEKRFLPIEPRHRGHNELLKQLDFFPAKLLEEVHGIQACQIEDGDRQLVVLSQAHYFLRDLCGRVRDRPVSTALKHPTNARTENG